MQTDEHEKILEKARKDYVEMKEALLREKKLLSKFRKKFPFFVEPVPFYLPSAALRPATADDFIVDVYAFIRFYVVCENKINKYK